MEIKNLAISSVTLAPSPAGSGTTLELAGVPTTDFPALPFLATTHPSGTQATKDTAEIVEVTAIDGVELTIVREQGGTTAKSIGGGWVFFAGIYKEHFDEVYAALAAKADAGDIISDHGALSGLTDDDHTQYHNNTRGDARYYLKAQTYTQAEVDAAIAAIDAGQSNPFHVANYGAVGDGIADDFDNIQAAIEDAKLVGGTVEFDAATYRITDQLTGYNGVSFKGKGMNSYGGKGTVISQETANKHGLYVETTTAAVGNFTIENIRFEHTAVTGTSHGIYFKNNSADSYHPPFVYIGLKNVFITGFRGWGFNAESLIVSHLDNVICQENANGFYLNGDGYGTNSWSTVNTSVTFTSCYANGNTGTGYHIKRTTYSAFTACAADSNGNQYIFETCNGIALNGCGAEYGESQSPSVGDSFTIKGASVNITLTSCFTLYNQHYSLYVTGSSYCITIIGFMDNDQGTHAVNGMKVDSGSYVTQIGGIFAGSRSVATNSVTILDDGAGGASFGDNVYFNNGIGIDGNIELNSGTLKIPSYGEIKGGAYTSLILGSYGTAVNRFAMEASPTGASPTLYVDGSDTNIHFNIQGKGTGRVQDHGVNIPTISSTDTLTNKRLTARHGTTTSSATPTINTDNYDSYALTAMAAAITSLTTNLTGTPTHNQKLMLEFTDNGTARAITHGASFVAGAAPLLTTTVINKHHRELFVYDSVVAKWVCMASDAVGY